MLCRLAIAVLLLGFAFGCRPQTATAPANTSIEFSALKLIDYPALAPEIERLLEDAVNHRLVGKSSDEYSEPLALAQRIEKRGKLIDYEFHLPLSKPKAEAIYKDNLAHFPSLWLMVDSESGIIRRCLVREIVF